MSSLADDLTFIAEHSRPGEWLTHDGCMLWMAALGRLQRVGYGEDPGEVYSDPFPAERARQR